MGILFILNGKIHSIQKKGMKINMYICSYWLLIFLQSSTSSPHINPEILTSAPKAMILSTHSMEKREVNTMFRLANTAS